MSKQKYYVVWKGRQPGVYASWDACKAQVEGFQNAKYKSFPTRAEAEHAYQGTDADYIGGASALPRQLTPDILRTFGITRPDAIAVDAACSGSPGPLEYRGVHLFSGKTVFHQGPFADGTNNVGEFLAIVHALARFQQQESDAPIYTDSENALLWVKVKRCRTKLQRTTRNTELFDLIARAESWLAENTYLNPLLKWKTNKWGEIPADFGRK
ncbi:MAG TPA: ribonuclease H family protein [Anaerolineales bacterium]|nr:ribonuclease H family protein [Anaerolineales bacterium]